MKKQQLEELLNADQVVKHRDGSFTAGWEFFYRHGQTAETHVNRVKAAFPNATVLDSGEVWKPFRGGDTTFQGSHWFVKFRLEA